MSSTLPNDVSVVFESYPPHLRGELRSLRQLILNTAAETEGVGEIEEALRWGEPSYLTRKPKSGSTIRISTVRGSVDQYGMYFNCQTTLLSTFRQTYPDLFEFSGNRAILFHVDDPIPEEALAHCIAMALRYHLDKK